jgi:peptidyl-prolyl cis-trans isomerase C
MKRCLISVALIIVSAVSMSAQPAATAPAEAPGAKVVATVNGESITAEQLDRLWNRMGAKMRAQYDKDGHGKLRFLENYVGKRLFLQKAMTTEFQKSPAVQAELEAARESALFDIYVRDVVASQIVTEAEMRKFYDDHPADFMQPEQVRVRMIRVGTDKHSLQEARAIVGDVMKELYGVKTRSGNDPNAITQAFAALAAKVSEHSSAASGGDLGWVDGSTLDKTLAEVAFAMKPGTFSGILETNSGVHLLLTQEQQAAAPESFEAARPVIREFLLSANVQKVMEAVNRTTKVLRASSMVTLYPENVK